MSTSVAVRFMVRVHGLHNYDDMVVSYKEPLVMKRLICKCIYTESRKWVLACFNIKEKKPITTEI